ncbi:MAG: two-component sensor histidine kinase [Nocardioides sp.]|nr:two-component sensor histidine kinase [Nocardioides sp.]
MSAIDFRAAEAPRRPWESTVPLRAGRVGRRIDFGLLIFCMAMLALMMFEEHGATIPYHVLFLMLTVVYGFRIWPVLPTIAVLAAVTASTGLLLYGHYRRGLIDGPELAEIPLMPALVVAMVWHARRRKAALDALQDMADRQREMFERERSFFRNTSHAIRTPVTIARGHLELAERMIEVVQARGDVHVALRQLDRMSVLSNRLLALAQLDSGETPPSERIRLSSFVLELGRNWAAGPRRDWVFECPEDAVVLADPAWLGLAVDALIENAVHFTDETGRIEICGQVSAVYCTIRVSDDGPGIAVEDLDHVFERFWHRRPPNGPMGSGLGLAIARATARSCGGDVRAANNRSGGAAFELALPRCRPHAI